MHVRTLTLVAGLAASAWVSFASALGLGEIQLQSALNQPLQAQIELLEVRDLTENEILVNLASREDFERAGIDRPFFLSELQFDVDLTGPRPVVRVRSRNPVREPYLNFLVELQWPNGRLLREYTLLMDLPTFTDDSAGVQASAPRSGAQRQQPVAQAQPQPRQPAPQPTVPSTRPSRQGPPPTGSAQAPAPQPQPSPGYTPGEYRVQTGDTLWEIAASARPSRAVSVQQTMLAIQRSNPDAFIDNNINLLKKGRVLRLPSEAEIQQLNQRQAVREVQQQNIAWSGDPNGLPQTGAQLAGSRRAASGPSAADEDGEGRLALVAPGDAEGTESGTARGVSADNAEALQNELAIALEELDRAKRENAELTDKVQALEDQIATMERLIDVSNEELRALQLASQQGDDAAGSAMGDDPAATGDDMAADDMAADDIAADDMAGDLAGDDMAGDMTDDASTQDPAVAAAGDAQTDAADAAAPAAGDSDAAAPSEPPAPSDPSQVVISTPPPQKGIVDLLLDNILYIAIGLVAVLGGLLAWTRLRNRGEDGEEDLSAFDQDDFSATGPEDDLDSELEQFEQELRGDGAAGEGGVEDPLGEADVYIAYGKFDQAEELLSKALAQEPERNDIRLKMLEVFAEAKNLDRFEEVYGEVAASGDAAAKDQAEHIRASVPGLAGAAAAAGQAVADDEEAVPSLDELSLDLDLDLTGEQKALTDEDLEGATANQAPDDTATTEAGADDLESLDFDLDLSEDAEAEQPAGDSLDFDLGGSEAETPEGEAEFDLGGDDDFSLDLDLDSDSGGDSESEDDSIAYDLGEDESITSNSDFDLSLDLEDSADAAAEGSDEDFGDLSLDFDSGSDREDFSSDEAAAPAGATDSADEFDLSLDLEDSADAAADSDAGLADLEFDSGEESAPAQSDDAGLDNTFAEADAEAASDDFSLDIDESSLDIDALDKEMAELGGDLDFGSDDLESLEAQGGASAEPEAPAPASDSAPADSASTDSAGDEDAEFDFLADTDEAATKLDLARAYMDMGDIEGARDILQEVLQEGQEAQRQEAQSLLDRLTTA